MAQANAYAEKRSRVIVILKDEINELKLLDDETKNYLKLNLYIKWNDPGFWRKICHAMPAPRINQQQRTTETIEFDEATV